MELLTLLVAITGFLLVFYVRPVYGLVIFTIASTWYPYAVGKISVGTIDFSVGRIIIMALFIKIFFATNLTSKFKFIWLDSFVIILFLAKIAAGFATAQPLRMVEYCSGDFFDMALPYFAVRLTITTKENFILFLKAIAWATGILAVFACFESLTGSNLLDLGRGLGTPQIRMHFFHRAQTTLRHSIYFGVFCAMTGAVCMSLVKGVRKNAYIYKILVGLIFSGSFFSMSGGGLLALLGAAGFICFYRYRYYWKQAIVAIVIMCCAVEIISNRHFYDVVDRLAFNSANSWYRTRLFEVAFFEGGMSGHWFTGYGFEEPGWGAKIDTRKYTDMVNHYLLELSRYGLLGFIPFCAVIIAATKKLFEGFCATRDDSNQWFIWCLGGSLFGVLLAFNSVSLFGVPMIMLFIIFGLCVAVPSGISRKVLIQAEYVKLPQRSEKNGHEDSQ